MSDKPDDSMIFDTGAKLEVPTSGWQAGLDSPDKDALDAAAAAAEWCLKHDTIPSYAQVFKAGADWREVNPKPSTRCPHDVENKSECFMCTPTPHVSVEDEADLEAEAQTFIRNSTLSERVTAAFAKLAYRTGHASGRRSGEGLYGEKPCPICGDHFESNDKLEAERDKLTAELAEAKKQVEHYREMALKACDIHNQYTLDMEAELAELKQRTYATHDAQDSHHMAELTALKAELAEAREFANMKSECHKENLKIQDHVASINAGLRNELAEARAERDVIFDNQMKAEAQLSSTHVELLALKSQLTQAQADVGELESALTQTYDALFLLLKRVTKLGEIEGAPDSPTALGWAACDTANALIRRMKGGSR